MITFITLILVLMKFSVCRIYIFVFISLYLVSGNQLCETMKVEGF